MYSKKVEFNIVNLKKMHLNTDILTQAIILKLKNIASNFLNKLVYNIKKI